ncbi:hypothetical protein [Pseudokineococcus lusitanus]|uniref:Uncharacterized protein n=1 Tax=Pseudokineococcus lusitanus TaxID=763993 RepID=A0A3N1HR40_9ACTN|nr:hypothetical protein [Pseudokineococcus lusitanus]ROP44967.1 hypothetical protein EDC03_1097 [Pseudokineococcus lusitanus]
MTDLQAPAPAAAAADLPARPRRRRRLVAGLVVAGLAAAAVTAGLVTGVVGPSRLVEGGSWAVRVAPVAPAGPGDYSGYVDGAVEEAANVYGSEYLVRPVDGQWLDLTVSLENDSPVPVRVTGVQTVFGVDGPLDVVDDVQVAVPVDELGPDDAWRPLGEGLTVPPGTSWRVRVVGRFDTACDDGPSVMTDGHVGTDQVVDVDYSVLGVPRHTSPTMSWTATMVGPFTLGC